MKRTVERTESLSETEDAASGELASVTLLLDFYGELLTPRQSEVLDLHCNSDLSLAEIAGELSVSRQAVHDAIRTGKALLERYEAKLGLLDRFTRQRDMAREALAQVEDLLGTNDPRRRDELAQKAVSSLRQLMEQL